MDIIPQHRNEQTRGPALMVLTVFLPILTFVFIAARIYTRCRITRKFGPDDWLALASYSGAITLSVLVIVAHERYQTGHRLADVPLATLVPHRRNIWICQIIYATSSTAIKLSVLAFYMRISSSSTRLFLWASWAAVLINAVFMGLFVVWLSVICQPLSTYWNMFNPVWMHQHPSARCFSENVVLPTFAFFSAFLDLLATLIPLLLLPKVDVTLKEKLMVYLLFAFGFLVFVFGIIRAETILKTVRNLKDYTWMLWECWVWTVLELYTAIMAASLPAIRPLFSSLNHTARPSTAVELDSSPSRRSRSPKSGSSTSPASSGAMSQTSSVSKTHQDDNTHPILPAGHEPLSTARRNVHPT